MGRMCRIAARQSNNALLRTRGALESAASDKREQRHRQGPAFRAWTGTGLASCRERRARRMKSAVTRFLLTSKGDPRQSVRLRRFLLASATYAICLPLLALACGFGMVARDPALLVAAAMVAVNLGFYLALRSGLNLRFEDPSMTRAQVFAANAVLMFAVYSFDQGRAMVLNLSLVVLTFGVFRFTTREFVR